MEYSDQAIMEEDDTIIYDWNSGESEGFSPTKTGQSDYETLFSPVKSLNPTPKRRTLERDADLPDLESTFSPIKCLSPKTSTPKRRTIERNDDLPDLESASSSVKSLSPKTSTPKRQTIERNDDLPDLESASSSVKSLSPKTSTPKRQTIERNDDLPDLESASSPVKSLSPKTSTPKRQTIERNDDLPDLESTSSPVKSLSPRMSKRPALERYDDLPDLKRRPQLETLRNDYNFTSLPVSSDSENSEDSSVKIVENLNSEEHVVISSDSSVEQIKTECCTPKYHNDNKETPIYSTPTEALTAVEIFKLAFGEKEEKYACTEKPVGVRYNSVFIINLDKIDLRSLYADDNGVWSVATPRKYFRVEIEDGKVTDVKSGHTENYTHLLKRQYGKHQATFTERGITFQRIISTVCSKSGSKCRFAVVQYIHRDGKEGDVVLHPHGNTKHSKKRPFLKTDPEIIEKIKEDNLDNKPKKLFKSMVDEAGGPLHSSSAASEPRNLQQIYNVRKQMKAEKNPDEFTHLLSQVKESSFVHDLTIDASSVQYVLASEKQLKDLEHFCTHPLKFSVFSIDSTYNVGNFYVTNTCFQNFKIVHADGRYRGRHPYEIGPTFIHTEKSTNNFVSFFCSLLRMNPNLKTIQAIGSDGDEAIMNASLICFQDAQKLLCSTHKKDNIQRKLKNDFRTREVASNHILSDIFGKDVGTVYEKGLIDSVTTQEFDKKVMNLKATWDCLQSGFHSWFLKYESDLFKRHLIAGVTNLAHVEKHYSTNQVESTNNHMKEWLGRSKKLSYPVANQKIEEYVKSQQQEFEMAIYASGPLEIAKGYDFLSKQRHIWNAMTADDRRATIQTFWKSPLSFSPGTAITVAEESTFQPTAFQSSARLDKKLSISVDDVDLSVLSKEMLADLWRRAEDLLKSPDSVVKSPGFEGMYIKHSSDASGKNLPHLVTQQSAGKFVCDCRLYKSAKICEHVAVAAEINGKLEQYLEWRKRDKTTVNLSGLVSAGIKSGEKPKVRKPRKGGRTPLEKETASTHEREPLIADQSTAETLAALENMESVHDFELVYLFQTKAQMCYGCGIKFSKANENNNLIVRKYCEREYTFQGVKKCKWQFAYFHLKNNCIKKKFPEYRKELLTIAKETVGVVPKEVKDKLLSMGINV